MPKKILIISNVFYPKNSPRSFRATELAKQFSKLGHDVTVLTPKDESIHYKFEEENNVSIVDLGKMNFKEINYKNSKVNLLKRLIRRVLNLFFEYPDIELMFKVKRKLKKQPNYDLLISIAVPFPIHWGVAWASKKNNIANVWAADCGDPFYFNKHDSFKKLFYFKYFEIWFSKKADFIIIPFEGLKKYFFKEFEKKYKIIPQGFDFDKVKKVESFEPNNIVTFAYSGGFIKNSRDPNKLLNYLSSIDKPFKFIVYNEQEEFLKPYKSLLGDKLIVKKYIPREKLLFELSKMDFLINLEFDPTNQVPSKLIDYSLVGRPILLIKNQEFNKNIINEFLDKNYKNQFVLDNIDSYNIKNVANQFLQLITGNEIYRKVTK